MYIMGHFEYLGEQHKRLASGGNDSLFNYAYRVVEIVNSTFIYLLACAIEPTR